MAMAASRSQRFSRGLIAAFLVLCLAWVWSCAASYDEDAVLPPSLCVNDLLKTVCGSGEYLASAGWVAQDGTFVPKDQHRTQAGTPALRAGQEAGAGTQSAASKILQFKIGLARSQRHNACGRGKVRDVHHVSAVFPGVDPAYVMDVFLNPEHGNWNPSVRDIVLRHQRRVRADELFPDAFPERVASSPSVARNLDASRKDVFDIIGQVSEITIPSVIKAVTGPRYTADFIVARWDAQKGRGFTMATSHGAEELAAAAGVRKGQEFCLSVVMVAPGADAQGDFTGTQVHLVTHFDAQLPSKQLRGIVNISVRKSLYNMFQAWHRKALAAQEKGRHLYTN